MTTHSCVWSFTVCTHVTKRICVHYSRYAGALLPGLSRRDAVSHSSASPIRSYINICVKPFELSATSMDSHYKSIWATSLSVQTATKSHLPPSSLKNSIPINGFIHHDAARIHRFILLLYPFWGEKNAFINTHIHSHTHTHPRTQTHHHIQHVHTYREILSTI